MILHVLGFEYIFEGFEEKTRELCRMTIAIETNNWNIQLPIICNRAFELHVI
jgi:hypothetical protein